MTNDHYINLLKFIIDFRQRPHTEKSVLYVNRGYKYINILCKMDDYISVIISKHFSYLHLVKTLRLKTLKLRFYNPFFKYKTNKSKTTVR